MTFSIPPRSTNNKCNVCSKNLTLLDEVLITKQSLLSKENPLERLPHHYIYWENTAAILPKLISQILDEKYPNKVSKYLESRKLLENIPKYEINNLKTEKERRRAILLLGIFAHAWVWLPYVSGIADRPEYFIPEQISVPLHQIAEIFARPPILTNSDLFDYNWRQNNLNEDVSIHNLDILNGFLENDAEKYFYLIYFLMTWKGELVIQAMLKIQKSLEEISCVDELFFLKIAENLDAMAKSLEEIRQNLAQVFSKINKEEWFNKVKYFSLGWNNKDMFPNGVVYKGVEAYSEQGQFFYGPSGFQYSVFQCLDAFLDVKHEGYTNQVDARLYMPSNQTNIINAIENSPKLRTLLTEFRVGAKKITIDIDSKSYRSVTTSYNNCIRQVKNIRGLHFGVVSKYLTKMILQELEDKIILTTGGQQNSHENLLRGIINHPNIQAI